jgi:hypothetical protein
MIGALGCPVAPRRGGCGGSHHHTASLGRALLTRIIGPERDKGVSGASFFAAC